MPANKPDSRSTGDGTNEWQPMGTQHHDQSMPEVALSLEDTGPRTITMITTRLDTRRDLADSGVTISATGIKSSILHRFQEESDYEIKGYDGQITKAAGQGYAKISPGNQTHG
jgi:hypothetical protein